MHVCVKSELIAARCRCAHCCGSSPQVSNCSCLDFSIRYRFFMITHMHSNQHQTTWATCDLEKSKLLRNTVACWHVKFCATFSHDGKSALYTTCHLLCWSSFVVHEMYQKVGSNKIKSCLYLCNATLERCNSLKTLSALASELRRLWGLKNRHLCYSDKTKTLPAGRQHSQNSKPTQTRLDSSECLKPTKLLTQSLRASMKALRSSRL